MFRRYRLRRHSGIVSILRRERDIDIGADHEKGRSCRNNSILPRNIFDTDTWKTDWNNRPEAQNLFNQSCDVWHFLLEKTSLPCVSVRVDFHDLVIGSLLDLLAVCAGEVGDAHDEVSGDSVESGGYHG